MGKLLPENAVHPAVARDSEGGAAGWVRSAVGGQFGLGPNIPLSMASDSRSWWFEEPTGREVLPLVGIATASVLHRQVNEGG